MRKVEIINGYGFIDESGTVTNKFGKARKTYKLKNVHYFKVYNNTYRVVDLMAKAFFPNFDSEKHKISFKDGNSDNLALSNLKLEFKWQGFKNTREKALAIKTLHESGFSYSRLMLMFNIPKSTIRNYAKTEF